jgi:hypothetical protein
MEQKSMIKAPKSIFWATEKNLSYTYIVGIWSISISSYPLDGEIKMQNSELFKISRGNLEWLKENYETLKKEYDGLWVVIKDKEIVTSASTFDEIIKTIRKHDPNRVIVEYIQSESVAMFF